MGTYQEFNCTIKEDLGKRMLVKGSLLNEIDSFNTFFFAYTDWENDAKLNPIHRDDIAKRVMKFPTPVV